MTLKWKRQMYKKLKVLKINNNNNKFGFVLRGFMFL